MRVHSVFLLLLAGGTACAAISPDELARTLRQMESQLQQHKKDQVLAALPDYWEVPLGERQYVVSTEPLRDLLESSENPDIVADDGKLWLEHLAWHLETASTSPASAASAAGALKNVLKRPEFAGLAGPSAWDLFRERMLAKIGEFFDRIFRALDQHPQVSRDFFWVALGAAALALGWWLLRRWKRDEMLSLRLPPPARSRSADEWITAAKAASDRGDFRTAIQCAYWAGVAGLETRGALARNRAQTPRETLRAASHPRTGVAPPFAGPLSILTNSFERYWYAGFAAGASDFATCRTALEALGYRWD